MQEFWATVSVNHTSLRFKMNNKSYTLNLKIFRDVLQICPKLPSQKFEDPPFEEEILSFIRDLGHTGEIKDMYHKKNVDYVYLLWEDLVYQVENKKSKKNNDSKAYNEYYAVASGALPPKAKTKYKKKPDELVTPSKSKSSLAAKGTRLKTPAKVTQSCKKRQSASVLKAKGLDVLSEVSLIEDEQIKLAIKRSKKDFHISHASGSGDGVDIQSKVPDEQQQKVTGTNEGAGVRPEVPSVPKCNSESEEESWTFSQNDVDDVEESDMNDDSEETKSNNDGDDLTHPNLVYSSPDHELTEEEEENKKGDDEDMKGEREQDEEDDLYRDVNINLERSNVKMTNAQANQDTEETHVTLTTVPPVVQQQSSSVSSDMVSKFINPSPDIVNKSDIQKNLYNALVESYNSNKYIFSSYGDVVTLKRGRDDQDKDDDPFAGSNRGSKKRRSGKEAESSKELTHKESKSTKELYQKVDDLEEQSHQEFNTGNDDETFVREALDVDESQWNPSSFPTLDREWHKTKTVDNRPPQPWITQMDQAAGTQSSFNEFLATPINFSAFIMNRLKIYNLTQEILTGPTYDLIKYT
uniref:Retrovirus-related Pol polyprotein from transposon TNT 1-94 n=1 Tax=Tanacetum cinerariifolium TaxID=118510 RepID=A0A6L2P450_TANCI|nr:hypothetical protein [Tanacetum cinerariifolium]